MHDETALALASVLGERNEGFIQMSYIPNSSRYEGDAQDHTEFLFRATIDVPEGGSFERNWMITARKDAQTWKVSNFGEYE